jgi:deoxyribonuclease V
VSAAVGFAAWTDSVPAIERTRVSMEAPAAYVPGSFYQRELPFLLGILEDVPGDIVVIDGYVTLDSGKHGLGAKLHEAHPARPVVIGVAKRPWRGGGAGVPIVRGASATALHVTAIGMDVADAARRVVEMHGVHRTPTLLKRVDRLARDSHRT